MNKTELVAAIAANAGLSKKDSEKALKAFVEVVTEELKKGEKVQLVGFGTFEVKERAERQGINPQTKTTLYFPQWTRRSTDTAMELDGSLLSMDELEPRLTERHSQNPDLTLSLECHKSVEFQRVVDVLTRIQAAGISRIGIIHEAVD